MRKINDIFKNVPFVDSQVVTSVPREHMHVNIDVYAE